MWRDKLGSSTVYKTSTILWYTLQSHKVIAEFSKQKIKCHPSNTSIFFCFVITSKIYVALQEISQMQRDNKLMSTKSDQHHGSLTKLE